MHAKLFRWPILLPFALLLFASLACGGFQVRVTPAAQPTPTVTLTATVRPATATPPPTLIPTPRPPTAAPSATPTQMAAGLAPGKAARISASGGVNVREQASASAKLLGKLGPGVTVTIKGGPVQASDFTWWQVDDGAGMIGWVAAGTKDDPWLAPEPAKGDAKGGGKLVNRPIRLGDRVQVTTEEGKALTVREAAGVDAPPVARSVPGTQFTVRGGPIRQDNYLWWQIEGDAVKGWAAEGETNDRWLTPVEP
jgi:SH3-like domain-containing protein